MQYYSLENKKNITGFKQAVLKGLADDRGLYFPKAITPLPKNFIKNIADYSNQEIAFLAIRQFIGDGFTDDILQEIINETLCFDFPTVKISKNIYALELFHGPTMAFKDVGARFMARCLGQINKNSDHKTTVLVATSGDTGGAVASGFLGVKNVDVVILYPSKKVSEVQEKQLTTLGENITALEVNGTFDDCQAMVKKAFLDKEIIEKRNLTSANSINIARWLPQMFYYFFAFKQLINHYKEMIFSVPSGNFGNICAGILAKKLGLPIKHFIAATNVNDVVPEYLLSQIYKPKPSIQTISNAMDVGNPSNFVRIQELYNGDWEMLKKELSGFAFTDDETKNSMKKLYTAYKYIADPHGAVGYLGLQQYGLKENEIGVFLETAHPVKFLDVVTPVIGKEIDFPPQIAKIIDKEKKAITIKNYEALKSFLFN